MLFKEYIAKQNVQIIGLGKFEEGKSYILSEEEIRGQEKFFVSKKKYFGIEQPGLLT